MNERFVISIFSVDDDDYDGDDNNDDNNNTTYTFLMQCAQWKISLF
jgi:hypothetical protein